MFFWKKKSKPKVESAFLQSSRFPVEQAMEAAMCLDFALDEPILSILQGDPVDNQSESVKSTDLVSNLEVNQPIVDPNDVSQSLFYTPSPIQLPESSEPSAVSEPEELQIPEIPSAEIESKPPLDIDPDLDFEPELAETSPLEASTDFEPDPDTETLSVPGLREQIDHLEAQFKLESPIDPHTQTDIPENDETIWDAPENPPIEAETADLTEAVSFTLDFEAHDEAMNSPETPMADEILIETHQAADSPPEASDTGLGEPEELIEPLSFDEKSSQPHDEEKPSTEIPKIEWGLSPQEPGPGISYPEDADAVKPHVEPEPSSETTSDDLSQSSEPSFVLDSLYPSLPHPSSFLTEAEFEKKAPEESAPKEIAKVDIPQEDASSAIPHASTIEPKLPQPELASEINAEEKPITGPPPMARASKSDLAFEAFLRGILEEAQSDAKFLQPSTVSPISNQTLSLNLSESKSSSPTENVKFQNAEVVPDKSLEQAETTDTNEPLEEITELDFDFQVDVVPTFEDEPPEGDVSTVVEKGSSSAQTDLPASVVIQFPLESSSEPSKNDEPLPPDGGAKILPFTKTYSAEASPSSVKPTRLLALDAVAPSPEFGAVRVVQSPKSAQTITQALSFSEDVLSSEMSYKSLEVPETAIIPDIEADIESTPLVETEIEPLIEITLEENTEEEIDLVEPDVSTISPTPQDESLQQEIQSFMTPIESLPDLDISPAPPQEEQQQQPQFDLDAKMAEIEIPEFEFTFEDPGVSQTSHPESGSTQTSPEMKPLPSTIPEPLTADTYEPLNPFDFSPDYSITIGGGHRLEPGVDIIAAVSLLDEFEIMLIQHEHEFALMVDNGETAVLLKSFPSNPLIENDRFTLTQEAVLGAKSLFIIHVGDWQGILALDNQEVRLQAEL